MNANKITRTPLVSVITLTFNSERYIENCIDSVQKQSHSSVEHVIVDSGSSDRTIEIIERYLSSKDLVFPIRIEKLGYCPIPEARALGIDRASGELIAILDSDDTWDSEKLAIQTSVFEENSQLVMCGSTIKEFNIERETSRLFAFPGNNDDLRKLLGVGVNPFAHSAVMFRRSAYVESGGYWAELRKAEDFGLWLSLSRVGQMTSVSRPLTTIVVRSDSHTRAFEWDRFPWYWAIALLGNESRGGGISRSDVVAFVETLSLDFLNMLFAKSIFFLILKNPQLMLKPSVARLLAGGLFLRRKYIFRALISPDIPSSFSGLAKLKLARV